jgi:hypothetical protein
MIPLLRGRRIIEHIWTFEWNELRPSMIRQAREAAFVRVRGGIIRKPQLVSLTREAGTMLEACPTIPARNRW